MIALIIVAVAGLLLLAILLRPGTASTRSDAYNRYLGSPVWRSRAARCLRLTKGRCALFSFLRARHAHHLDYSNFEHEWVVRDIVPLSEWAHRLVHAWVFWRGPLRAPMCALLRIATVATALLTRPVLVVGIVVAGVILWPVIADRAAEALRAFEIATIRG